MKTKKGMDGKRKDEESNKSSHVEKSHFSSKNGTCTHFYTSDTQKGREKSCYPEGDEKEINDTKGNDGREDEKYNASQPLVSHSSRRLENDEERMKEKDGVDSTTKTDFPPPHKSSFFNFKIHPQSPLFYLLPVLR